MSSKNPKAALIEKLIRKSKKGEISLLRIAVKRGISIKKLRPRTSRPKIFRIVEKSFLSGEIIISMKLRLFFEKPLVELNSEIALGEISKRFTPTSSRAGTNTYTIFSILQKNKAK